MLPFYAFVGKLHTLLETVAAGIHMIRERLSSAAFMRADGRFSG
jgi:hypothetical protein